jgi:hypothetical protein
MAKIILSELKFIIEKGPYMKKGDRIFSEYEKDLEWIEVIAFHIDSKGKQFFGIVMAGEKMTTIRRIGK